MFSFQSRLRGFLKKQRDATPKELARLFLKFYEPIVFEEDELIDGIKKLPRPFRELAAADQAWGMISSDGFNNYVEQNDEAFDEEVRLGLVLLSHEHCIEALLEARKLLAMRWRELDARDDLVPGNPDHSEEIRRLARLTEEDDERLFDAFYRPLARFEDMLGEHLIRILGP